MAIRGDHYGSRNLPTEVFSNILPRLPIESIMVCKSVCKPWNSLINNNYFAKLQLSNSNNPSSPYVLIEKVDHSLKLGYTVKRFLLNVNNCRLGEIPVRLHVKDKNTYMPIWSSLDGLLCVSPVLRHPGPVVIYNPLRTGDYICLPEPRNPKEFAIDITLGFDRSINKYKVVKVMTDIYSEFVDVITVGKDIFWRRLGLSPFSDRIILHSSGTFHQGSIYWVIRAYNGDNMRILKFDLTTEMFATISYPKLKKVPGRGLGFFHWQSLGECLILTLIDRQDWSVCVWRLVKEVTTFTVVGYECMRIETPYNYAALSRMIYLNSKEDSFLLQSCNGFERIRGKNQDKIGSVDTQFSLHGTASKKNQLKNLTNLQSLFFGGFKVQMWSFKPSLISIKEAMLTYNPLFIIPKTLKFPTQKAILIRESGIGFRSHTVRIDFCATSSYRETAAAMKTMLEASFSGINVVLENYRPPFPKRLLGKMAPIFQFGAIVLLIGSGQVFPRLGFAAPLASWYYSLRTNSSGTNSSTWLLGNSLESFLETSGAFEVSCDGVQVFSKLKEKRLPSEIELQDLVNQSVRLRFE